MSIRLELKKRAQSAILKKAFLGCGNISVALLALFLAPLIGLVFGSWWWALLVIALGAAAFFGAGAFRAQRANLNAQAIASALEAKFQSAKIRQKRLRDKTDKALEYFQEIEEAVEQTKEGLLRDRLRRSSDDVLDWVVSIYELAARMQLSAPEAFDVSRESESTHKAYGLNKAVTEDFGRRCLLARRRVERGSRFVLVWSGPQGATGNWDNHGSIPKELPPIPMTAIVSMSSGIVWQYSNRGVIS